MLRWLSLLLALVCLPCFAQDDDPAQNVALGKTCAFAPQPNYYLTTKGDTDAKDLTDGKLTQRPDQHMWFESHAVGWGYLPVCNLRVDLESVQPIREVAIRFLGGSPQSGICFPGWVDVLVSDDDQTYYRVARYSKWNPGDGEKFGVPQSEGKAWVHRIRFTDLKTRGRYVGIAFGGTGLTCSDELYVFKGDHDPQAAKFAPEQAADFSVTRPQACFMKPEIIVTNEIAAPIPVGLLDESNAKRPATLNIEMPRGVEILAGGVGDPKKYDMRKEPLAEGATRYSFRAEGSGASKLPWGRLYVKANLKDGETSMLGYSLDWGDGRSPVTALPLRAVTLPPAPRLKRMMMALGWWSLADTKAWPDGLKAAQVIGLNTLSTFTMWMKPDDNELWAFAEEGRRLGFKMLNVDSTWHQMMSKHKNDAEVYCQFADGKHGERMCPSYRGPFYAEELQRVAGQCARLKPQYLSTDVELWNWRGPVDAEKCTRCQADKQKSGVADWAGWKLQKGFEMWRDLYEAVQAAAKKAGHGPVEMGCYDWRPGENYQFTWPFDRLYPKYLQNGQVSTYTPLEPWHIGLVGDEVRTDRAKLPKSDLLPWLTPGDAGAFTGEALRCAMLECFLNGARGAHFWSSRYWDAEYLVAYNQAVRAVAPIEDIIVDGKLYDGAKVEAPARVSGMINGNNIALLVGEYYGHGPTTVNVTLTAPAASQVIDTETGEKVGEIEAGPGQKIEVKLGTYRSRVLWIRPR